MSHLSSASCPDDVREETVKPNNNPQTNLFWFDLTRPHLTKLGLSLKPGQCDRNPVIGHRELTELRTLQRPAEAFWESQINQEHPSGFKGPILGPFSDFYFSCRTSGAALPNQSSKNSAKTQICVFQHTLFFEKWNKEKRNGITFSHF